MDKLIERTPIGDLLGLLAPGYFLVLLLQLVAPGVVPLRSASAAPRSELMIAVSTLIAAYVAGIILNAAVNVGTRKYIIYKMKSESADRNPGIRLAPPMIWYLIVRLFFWIPLPRFDQSIVAVFMRMSRVIEQASKVADSIHVLSPWEQLELYRVFMAKSTDNGTLCPMDAAERLHSRLLFALTISLVSSGAALAAVVDSAATLISGAFDFRSIVIGTAWALTSLLLRLVAGRLWEHELLLVASLHSGSAVVGGSVVGLSESPC